MNRQVQPGPEPSKRALQLPEFCNSYGVSRATAYRMIAAGKLRSAKIGGRRVIPIDAAEALLASEVA